MKPGWFPLLCLATLLAGCQTSVPLESDSPSTFRPNARQSLEITPADSAFAERRQAAVERQPAATPDRGALTEAEIVELPKFTVTKQGFRNFGFSVVTNVEVRLDGPIEWMQVGVVLPGSPAARSGLATGMQVLAIDGVIVTEMDRPQMLSALFERSSGEQIRLLVFTSRQSALPRFITLR